MLDDLKKIFNALDLNLAHDESIGEFIHSATHDGKWIL
jgi:hypothetical protein